MTISVLQFNNKIVIYVNHVASLQLPPRLNMNNQHFYLTSYHQIRRYANLEYSRSYIIGLCFMGVVYAPLETYNSYILRGKLYT